MLRIRLFFEVGRLIRVVVDSVCVCVNLTLCRTKKQRTYVYEKKIARDRTIRIYILRRYYRAAFFVFETKTVFVVDDIAADSRLAIGVRDFR